MMPSIRSDQSITAIDIAQETLIPIREVPRRLPPRPNGKQVHISACYRWVQRGVQGVRLDSTKIGGSTYTSVEALQRFADHLNSRKESESSPQTLIRNRRIEQASKHAVEALHPTKKKRKP